MTFFRATVVCAVLGSISLIALAAGESSADWKTLNHLQQIGQASLMYSAENRGYLPSHFGQLTRYLRKPDAFLDARTDTAPPADWEKMTADQQSDWAKQHCEFDLTNAAGQRIFKIKNSNTVPLAVTRDKPGQKKVTLFADGRAQVEGSGVDPAQLPPPPATKP